MPNKAQRIGSSRLIDYVKEDLWMTLSWCIILRLYQVERHFKNQPMADDLSEICGRTINLMCLWRWVHGGVMPDMLTRSKLLLAMRPYVKEQLRTLDRSGVPPERLYDVLGLKPPRRGRPPLPKRRKRRIEV